MTVKFLANMLTPDTTVMIIDYKTKKVLYHGSAENVNYSWIVKDWNFSNATKKIYVTR